jgi:hypothetical protein
MHSASCVKSSKVTAGTLSDATYLFVNQFHRNLKLFEYFGSALLALSIFTPRSHFPPRIHGQDYIRLRPQYKTRGLTGF